ncbi:MAG: tetratricopeptide repeat protein [Proteobacteria bacterium]|nr:tetratricopeptide repeat protein [Pseudomonadota bacterium]
MKILLRATLFFALLLAVGLGVDAASREPGAVVMRWHGYELQMTAAFLSTAAAITLIATYLFARLMAWLDRVPAMLWQGRVRKRQQQGFHYLLEGMDALAAGDNRQALKLVDKAARLMPEQPVVHVLQAEAARRGGDHATAISHFQTLSKSGGSSFLGLKGLAEEAFRQNDLTLARQLVDKAIGLRPRSAWAVERTLQLALAGGDINTALDTLPTLKRAEMDDNRQAFLTACVRHAQASQLADNHQPEQALAALNKGLKACPDFVPLYLLGADILTAQGEESRTLRMLADGWQHCPRHELLARWVSHYGPDYGKEFIQRAQKLVRPLKDEMSGQLALAEMYIRARDWQKARALLAPLVEDTPNRRVFTLLAEVEDGLEPTSRAAHQWLKMALDAPEWIEPAGHVEAFRTWAGRLQAARPAAEALPAAPHEDMKFLPHA